MNNDRSHRWFHALVVTGAAITACGGSSDDSAADASSDASPDAPSLEGGSSVADGGGIIIIDDVRAPEAAADVGDARDDPRCCTITN